MRRVANSQSATANERSVVPGGTVEAYLNALPAAGHAVIANAAHALSQPEWREVSIQQLLGFFADL